MLLPQWGIQPQDTLDSCQHSQMLLGLDSGQAGRLRVHSLLLVLIKSELWEGDKSTQDQYFCQEGACGGEFSCRGVRGAKGPGLPLPCQHLPTHHNHRPNSKMGCGAGRWPQRPAFRYLLIGICVMSSPLPKASEQDGKWRGTEAS